MASGGPSRLSQSEPRKRSSNSGGFRLSNALDEDFPSVSSGQQEDRLNNWDFTDWRPSATFDSSKQSKALKKGNEEKGKGKSSPSTLKENTFSQKSNSLDSGGSRGDNTKTRTPSTFPRTKVTPITTASQVMAMENLKQQLTFSDVEEASVDGERNNERYVRPKNRQPEMSVERNATRSSRNTERDNRKTLNSEGDAIGDRNHVVGRLMQMRDHIKQASTMMDNLQSSSDPVDQARVSQLEQVIVRLKEQEHNYLELLLKLAAAREEALLMRQNSAPSNTDGNDVGDGTDSEDLHVHSDDQSQTSDDTTDDNRPRIEEHLGRHSDTEAEDQTDNDQGAARVAEVLLELDSTLVPEAVVADGPDVVHLAHKRLRLESDLDKKNQELQALREQHEMLEGMLKKQEEQEDRDKRNAELMALREQHDLLQKMLQQQQQLKTLQARQSQLLALQKEAETKLAEEKTNDISATLHMNGAASNSDNEESGSQPEGGAGMMNGDIGDEDDEEEEEEDSVDVVPQDLKDLRARLDYLKNFYDIKEQIKDRGVNQVEAESSINNAGAAGSERSYASEERKDLQNKLTDLQQKKQHMDSLLQELQNLQSERLLVVNNELDGASTTSSQVRICDSIRATANANETAEDAEQVHDIHPDLPSSVPRVLSMLDARKKLKKLQDVKTRLDEMKGLLNYYQSGSEFIHGTGSEDGASAPSRSNRAIEPSFLRIFDSDTDSKQGNKQDAALGRSESPSSQLSSNYDAWADDPEIQEKVRRLKAAKEKLHRLQELVTMVAQSPDGVDGLSEDIAELAASLDEDGLSESSAPGAEAAPLNIPNESQLSYEQQEAFYQTKMEEQKQELTELMEERRKLLSVQEELQKLHDSLPPTGADESENVVTAPEPPARRSQPTSRSQPPARPPPPATENSKSAAKSTSITFGEPLETVITNEELYGRMRQQRMLQEELREKKKELEDMMRKDRPKKQYSRNQDNQSDNISFSNKSDPFGTAASQDQTMATWGGSTVDNLESIEEDEGGSGDGQECDDEQDQVDDGYPSDGIVQVEEEEEAQDDSEDHDTYTIEEEPYLPQSRRKRKHGEGDKRKGGATYPQPTNGEMRGMGYNYWAPGNTQVLNNARASRSQTRNRKKVPRNGESSRMQSEISGIKQQLSNIMEMMRCPASNLNLTQSPNVSPHQPDPLMYSAQLQQQQLLFNLNQCYSQLLNQQQDMSDRFGRLERIVNTNENPYSDVTDTATRRVQSHASGISQFMSPSVQQQNLPQTSRPTQGASSNRQRPFYFDPESFQQMGSQNNAESSTSTRQRNPFYFDPDAFQQYSADNVTSQYATNPLRVEVEKGQGERQPYGINRFRSSDQRSYQSGNVSDSVAANQGSEDEVAIETIQAQDTAIDPSIPKLNLQQLLRARAAKESSRSGGKKSEDAVIGRRFPTPGRSAAGARLASQRQPPYRPGLSAGISGTAYLDGASVSSAVSSCPGPDPTLDHLYARAPPGGLGARPKHSTATADLEWDASDQVGEFSLFEALRETIYSEVATLISQNENRPHYLIDLFRELQMLSTDYLRQRALYAISDLVAKSYLTEENIKRADKLGTSMQNQASQTATELTPSESNITSDDEQGRLYPRGYSQQAKPTPDQSVDYAENVEIASSLSTPDSHFDNPFAQDSLGDTVIHLDKALQRMREYEKQMLESREGATGASATSTSAQGAAGGARFKYTLGGTRQTSDAPPSSVASSSAQDNGSDGSISDVPYPRIDTHQLDQQIKGIMTEIIPVLKEHMDDVCSQQLLQYIKRLVLSLTKQKDDTHEFVRFFHKQLGSILQDSLAKFEGRKMRECGEDLLVDLSEILFNELAFFRLMQDLDDPGAKVKPVSRHKQAWRQESQTSTDTNTSVNEENDSINKVDDSGEESSSEESSMTSSDDETSENERNNEEDEQEMLGKDRDDELASKVEITEEVDDDPGKPLNIQLTSSETKPMNRIGSDEDDGDEDEAFSNEDPSETAVSRDAEKLSQEESESNVEMDGDASEPQAAGADSEGEVTEKGNTESLEKEGLQNGTAEKDEPANKSTEADESSNQEAEAVEVTANGETEEVTVDDLPPKLNSLSKEELDAAIKEEANSNDACQAVLEVVGADGELAGDSQAIKEPPTPSDSQSTREL